MHKLVRGGFLSLAIQRSLTSTESQPNSKLGESLADWGRNGVRTASAPSSAAVRVQLLSIHEMIGSRIDPSAALCSWGSGPSGHGISAITETNAAWDVRQAGTAGAGA